MEEKKNESRPRLGFNTIPNVGAHGFHVQKQNKIIMDKMKDFAGILVGMAQCKARSQGNFVHEYGMDGNVVHI